MAGAKYLAFDLGAESGRAVLGAFDGERLRMEEVYRFANGPTRILDTLHWDPLRLFGECKHGLGLATAAHGADLSGIGVDTWGVDFALLGRGDVLFGNPRHYRDRANDGMLEAAFAVVPPDRIFARTGVQFAQYNTLYQLLSLKRTGSPLLDNAQTLLMMADLFHFWLTGVKAAEYSIGSTTQMIDPVARAWALDLVEDLSIPAHVLTDLVNPATPLGPLRADIAAECGCGPVPIIAPAAHDTASAVVAVPAETPDYAYISSGTWSLVGIETMRPHVSPEMQQANFTNEGGACGTTRLLKNVVGLWLVQECRRVYARRGADYSYAELGALAEESAPFGPLIDPDAPDFLAPADMAAAIAAFCGRTGQPIPNGIGPTIRCCLESLALAYRRVLEQLEAIRGRPISLVHIVGGGVQNRLLCQFTADATRRTVIAGPVEATAIGNVLMQAMGRGHLASLTQAREVVRRSFSPDVYAPCPDGDRWEAAYQRFVRLCDPAVGGNEPSRCGRRTTHGK